MSLPAVVSEREPLPPGRVERLPDPTAPTVLGILANAVEKGIPVEALERLQAMYERDQDRRAAAEFSQAVADFQRACPTITKNKAVDYASSSGARVQYDYADLPAITKTIAAPLQAVGLAYTWNSTIDNGKLVCTCFLRHVNGHRESAQFVCPVESKAGMSEQQKHAAALSFARRQSLIQVLGLVTSEAEGEATDPSPITGDQAADLEDLCKQAGVAPKSFFKWVSKRANMEIDRFADVPAVCLASAVEALKEKQTQRRG